MGLLEQFEEDRFFEYNRVITPQETLEHEGLYYDEYRFMLPTLRGHSSACLRHRMARKFRGTDMYFYKSLRALYQPIVNKVKIRYAYLNTSSYWLNESCLQYGVAESVCRGYIPAVYISSISLCIETGLDVSRRTVIGWLWWLVAPLCYPEIREYSSGGVMSVVVARRLVPDGGVSCFHVEQRDSFSALSLPTWFNCHSRDCVVFERIEGDLDLIWIYNPVSALKARIKRQTTCIAETEMVAKTWKLGMADRVGNLIVGFVCGRSDVMWWVCATRRDGSGSLFGGGMTLATTGCCPFDARLVASMIFAAMKDPSASWCFLVRDMYRANGYFGPLNREDYLTINRSHLC